MGIRNLFVTGCMTLGIATACFGQGWRTIVPLHSTRQDVQRLIGRPTEPNGLTYDLKTERVTIYYSDGPCVKGWPYGWNVASDVVTKIVVYPQTPLTLNQLGLDVRGYTKTQNPRLGGSDYTNKELGISVGVKENGAVEVIQYQPSIRDQHLLCPDAAEREREIESRVSTYATPVMSYSDVSPKEENARLEVFLSQLGKYPPESKIYVIAYAPAEECPAQGILRANRVKDHLVTKLGIDARRVTTIDGGRNSAVRIQLYVTRPGAPRPLSTPDMPSGCR
jgi:hypothetical protein